MFSNSSQIKDWSKLQHARDQATEEPQCYNYPDAFFPDKGGSAQPGETEWAKQTCAVCPLQMLCAEYGVRWERHGIWGGLSSRQRQDIRRKRRLPEPLEDAA